MHALLLAAALLLPTDSVRPSSVHSNPSKQAPHAIRGTVRDTAGQALASARVTVLELSRSTLTDREGRYELPSLPHGSYSVSFAMIGYAPLVRRVAVRDTDVVADAELRPTIVELPTVQATATPLAGSAANSPQPTTVVGGEALLGAQAPSLGETLDHVAGVHNLSTGTGIGKPVIRGLTSNRVLVLDDGQRTETQQWGDEHAPNVGTANADRIEVIRGPASVLYGSDALGGVINVIQRPLPDAIGKRGYVHGDLTTAYATNGRAPDGALTVEGAAGGFGARLELNGRTSSDVQTADYTLWNSGARALGGSGSVGYRAPWGNIAATYARRDERIGLTDDDPTATPTQRIGTDRARVDLTMPLGLNRLEANVGWERNQRREFEDATTTDVALGLLTKTVTSDVRLHHAPLGRLEGTIGLSALHTDFGKFGEETLIPDNTVTSAGLYAYEQMELGRWRLSAGARYDYRRLAVAADDELGVAAQTRDWSSVVGNAGVVYRLTDPVALVLSVGRGYRAPSSFELFANGVHEGTLAFERGNPDLKTETSLNTDLGVRVQTGRLSLDAGGFVNWIRNFIYTVPTGETDAASGFQIYDVTQGNARLAGIEGSADYHPLGWLHLQGTADWVLGTNTSTGNPLPSMPPFRATYVARIELDRMGPFDAPYFSVGGETNARQGRLDPAEAGFYAAAFDGAGYRSAGYTVANLGAGFLLETGAAPLRVDLQLRNVLDRAYAPYLSRLKTIAPDPGQGRALLVRLTTEF